MFRGFRTIFLSCLAASVAIAQEHTEASAQEPSLLDKVLQADDDGRSAALIKYVEDQIASGAVFEGQYKGLRAGGDPVEQLLQTWITDTPSEVFAQSGFRRACINALRDIVDEADEDLMAALKALADDEFEEDAIRHNAIYAMAQFGDRAGVDATIQDAMQKTSATDMAQQFQGWETLSDVYHNMREYDSAAKARKQMIRILEGAPQKPPGMSSLYYNCACSLALSGQIDEAIAHIQKALEVDRASARPQLGKRLLESDMDIAAVRKDERYQALFERYFGSGEKKEKKGEHDGDEGEGEQGEGHGKKKEHGK